MIIMQILRPTYMIVDKYVIDDLHTLSGGDVAYHIWSYDKFEMNDYAVFPEHAQSQMRIYCQTIQALLLAGF
jgi:hypothetical protein